VPSYHEYALGTLPVDYHTGGTEWLARRLVAAGRHFVRTGRTADGSKAFLQVGEANVSANQLLFDVQPVDGQLACNVTSINVAPMSTSMVTITGPIGKTVKVRFKGVAFVSETEFVIPGNNNYEYQLGVCPAGQRVVTPQEFEFYVEDDTCSPVAIMVTFK
jgi:hypothetical protein